MFEARTTTGAAPLEPPAPIPRRRRRGVLRWGLRGLLLAALAVPVGGCILTPPSVGSVTRAERLATFPTEGLPLFAPVELRFDAHLVPFVLAEDERDVPFVLGLLHGHLRRVQLEVLRRLARGELSQLGGPLARPVDELLRTLDLDRAVPEMVERLPEGSRVWLERYVEGLNLQSERQVGRPHDARLLGIERVQRWSVADCLAVGRLGSVDVALGRSLALLSLAGEPRFEELLARVVALDAEGLASFGPESPTPLSALTAAGKSGSNSFAVAGSRTTTGAPLLANDPHLGFFVPNFWCLVGYATPEHTVVGMTLPGVPVVVVGRNQHAAFGGTNMTAYSHALYDASAFGPEEVVERVEALPVRLWPDGEVRVRETPLGPVVSDLALFESLRLPPLALRWRGHEPSDEFTAFLRASHAASWEEFRAAFADYAVAGQNLLFASGDGTIGQLMAVEQVPAAARAGSALVADPRDERFAWPPGARGTPSTALPAAVDPALGYLVSANNAPLRTDPPLVAGGNTNDRVRRIAELIEERTPLDAAGAMAIQRDTYLSSGHAASRALAAAVGAPGGSSAAEGERRHDFLELLAGWDGRFDADSRGALAYQRLLDVLLATHYRAAWGERIERFLRGSTAVHRFVEQDLASGALPRESVVAALDRAADEHDPDETWGDVHRVPVQHPLGNAPVIGGAWRFRELRSGGTTGTVAKSAGPLTAEPHRAFFGAQSRHVSDLSDPDANWFVLLGGQDGWLGSEHLVDQVDLWETGGYVQMPLRRGTIERLFTDVLRLEPAARER